MGKKEKDPVKADFEEERIQDLLIAQALNEAAASYGACLSAVSARRNRGRLQIMCEILDLCLKPRNITSIMQGLNLNHKLLVKFLAELQEAKLLDANSQSTSKYVTTQGAGIPETFSRASKYCRFLIYNPI